VMPIEEINKAFDLMGEGKSIRSVITFDWGRRGEKFLNFVNY
jgi:hypothetical protein